MFQNKPAGGGLFQNTTGGGMLGGGQQQQGGGLFGGQQQQGGGLLGGQQQQGGSLLGGQQGGGLFPQNKQQSTGLFGGQTQGGGLFPQQQTGQQQGGLFQQQTGGGSILGQQQGGLFQQKPAGGGLFPQAGAGAQAGSFSLTGMYGGAKPGAFPDMSQAKSNKFQLSLTNPLRDRKVGNLSDKHKQFIEQVSKVLNDNQTKTQGMKLEDEEIVKKKATLADITYQFSQDAKLLYMKIKQARFLVDEMKSDLATYEDITLRNFDVCLDLLKGGRLPRLDIPSTFMVNITEYFDLRIRELKDKVGEIEELIKLSDKNEDSDEYEKVVMVLDELYNYYLNIANKVFQLNEYVATFKAQFIDYFKSQGSREVERIFAKRTTDFSKSDILQKLETISNNVITKKQQ